MTQGEVIKILKGNKKMSAEQISNRLKKNRNSTTANVRRLINQNIVMIYSTQLTKTRNITVPIYCLTEYGEQH